MGVAHRARVGLALGGLVVASAAAGQERDADGRPVERFEYTSYLELADLAEQLNYTNATWQAGDREVPRAYLTNIPARWRDRVADEVTVDIKKRLFFRLGMPLVLRANELIERRRKKAQRIGTAVVAGDAVAAEDAAWLERTAVTYAVKDPEAPFDAATLAALLKRIDIVPVSLALAQAAEESGWGTSRFAAEGNSLFGQWSWDENAIRPEQQRAALGDYGIAAFETPLESVISYMHNLNTHRAYAALRDQRAALRAAGEPIDGWALAETLTSYSERRAAYVDSLHTIMRVNDLNPMDGAYLGDGPTIYLVPVGEGARSP
jgi:Bax protein